LSQKSAHGFHVELSVHDLGKAVSQSATPPSAEKMEIGAVVTPAAAAMSG